MTLYADSFGGLTALRQREDAIRNALLGQSRAELQQAISNLGQSAVQSRQLFAQERAMQSADEARKENIAIQKKWQQHAEGEPERRKKEADFTLNREAQLGMLEEESAAGRDINPTDYPDVPAPVVGMYSKRSVASRPLLVQERDMQQGFADALNLQSDRKRLARALNTAQTKRDKTAIQKAQEDLRAFDAKYPDIAGLDPKTTNTWIGKHVVMDKGTGRFRAKLGRFDWEPEDQLGGMSTEEAASRILPPVEVPASGLREMPSEGPMPIYNIPGVTPEQQAVFDLGQTLKRFQPPLLVRVLNPAGVPYLVPPENVPFALQRGGTLVPQ